MAVDIKVYDYHLTAFVVFAAYKIVVPDCTDLAFVTDVEVVELAKIESK